MLSLPLTLPRTLREFLDYSIFKEHAFVSNSKYGKRLFWNIEAKNCVINPDLIVQLQIDEFYFMEEKTLYNITLGYSNTNIENRDLMPFGIAGNNYAEYFNMLSECIDRTM